MTNRFNFWNLQRFDEPAAGTTVIAKDPSKNGEPAKPAEGENKEIETVDIPDPKTGKVVKLPKEYQGLIQNIIGVAKSTAKAGADKKVKDVQVRLDELINKVGGGGNTPSYEEIKQTLTDLQEKDLPEAERNQNDLARKLGTLEKSVKFQTSRAEVYRSKFEANAIEQAITNSLDGHSVFSHRKTIRNVIADSNIKIEWEKDSKGNETGVHKMTVEMMLPDETGELTMQETSLKEGVSKWLARSDNANELKSNLAAGAGTSTTSGSRKDSTGQLVFKRSEIGGINPPRRKEYLEAMEKGLPHKLIDG